MGSKKKVIENSFLYTFSSILVKAISFLLLPIYTNFLTPNDYGTINLVNSFNSVATFIVSFSLYSAIVRFHTDYRNNLIILKRFYGTIIVFISISGASFFALNIIFKDLLVELFFDGIGFYPIIFISLLCIIFLVLHTVHQSILQAAQNGKKLTIINLIVFIIQVVLNLIFIGIFKLGAFGVILASLIINIGYLLFMLIDLKKSNLVTFCLDIHLLTNGLRYSIPIMPHNLSTHIASFVSRVFINKTGTLASVGLYSVANQFGSIIDLIQSSVNKAFTPWFFDTLSKKSSKENNDIVRFSEILLILYSLIYMIIGLFSQEFIIIMTEKSYWLAWTIIPILVMAYSVKSIYYFYINVLFYFKDASKKIFIASLSGSLADILLAGILVPILDMYGAALSFLLAKIIVVIIVVKLSKKYKDVGYKITKMLKIIIPSLLFMFLGLYFSYTKFLDVFSWKNFFFKVIVLILYVLYIIIKQKKLIKYYLKAIFKI